jgi:predicted RNA-binding Zn-ribbon protein involved in translation (DUF1610 family)
LALIWVAFRGSKSHFVCPQCDASFKTSILTYLFAPHMMRKRLVKCPNCGYSGFIESVGDKG